MDYLMLCCFFLSVTVTTVQSLVALAPHATGSVLMLPHPIVTSHQRLHMQLAAQLLARGHEVTIARWHPRNGTMSGAIAPPVGATVINLEGPMTLESNRKWIYSQIEDPMWKMNDEFLGYTDFLIGGIISGLNISPCMAMHRHYFHLLEQLRWANFSLGIIDPSAYPCSWVIMNQLQIPYVELAPHIPTYYLDKAGLTPTPFSYLPAVNNGHDDRMSFLARAKNVFDHPIFSSSFVWVLSAASTRWAIGWQRTENDPVMVMMLDDKLLAYSRPYSNSLVTMGLKERIRVPVQDSLTTFTNDPTSKGTIIFSLTTLGSKDRMSAEMKQVFLDVFKKFSAYRIIWRTLEPPLNNSVKHVIYTKWFNQTNLFADPKTKLLITHGGIGTVLEAVRHGLPMLGMPLGWDHHGNFARVTSRGLGAKVNKEMMNQERLTKGMKLLLEDRTVRRRSRQMCAMLESSAGLLDGEALWYTEFAMRHGGDVLKRRLSPQGERKGTFAYFGLDVILVSSLLAASVVVSLR